MPDSPHQYRFMRLPSGMSVHRTAQVVHFIVADLVDVACRIVVEADANLIGAIHDVEIGDDASLVVPDKTGACALGNLLAI